MCDCEQIQDVIIDYINRRKNQTECSNIAIHLSKCKRCREEVAFMIKIGQNQNAKLKNVPIEIHNSAFKKIPDNKPKYNSKDYLDSVYSSFQLIGRTFRFIGQII